MRFKFGRHAKVGIALDVFDWICVGLIPVLGDIADVWATFYWVRVAGVVGYFELLELIPIPLFDVLPINTFIGIRADSRPVSRIPSP